MDFPLGYIIALTQEEIDRKWPNINLGQNTHFSSLKRKGHNCLGFALGEDNRDADMLIFSKRLDLTACGLSNENLNHSAKAYAILLEHFYYYECCKSDKFEEGYEKIALYEGYDYDGDFGFLHAAIQLNDGRWKSKMGYYEDVEHDTLDVIAGDFYGRPTVIMKREIGLNIKLLSDDK